MRQISISIASAMELTTASATELTTIAETHQPLRARFHLLADEVSAACICFLVLISNSLTIFTMKKAKRNISEKIRTYIISLSMSDIIVALALGLELLFSRLKMLYQPIFPPYNSDILKLASIQRVTNTLISTLYFQCFSTSLLTLLVIALDRTFAIMKPLIYKNYVTYPRVRIMLACIWMYVSSMGCSFFIYFGLTASDQRMLETYNPTDYLPMWASETFMMPHMYIAVGGILISYSVAYFKICRLPRNKLAAGSKIMKDKNITQSRRIFRMLFVTVSVMVILWLPFGITYKLTKVNTPETPLYISDYVQPFIYSMTCCNCWVNPILYAYFNKDFRQAYYQVFAFWWKKVNKNAQVNPSTTITDLTADGN